MNDDIYEVKQEGNTFVFLYDDNIHDHVYRKGDELSFPENIFEPDIIMKILIYKITPKQIHYIKKHYDEIIYNPRIYRTSIKNFILSYLKYKCFNKMST